MGDVVKLFFLGKPKTPFRSLSPLRRYLPSIIAMSAVVLGLLSAPAGATQTPDQLLQQADQALQKQDYVSAAGALEAYLAQKPDDYRAEFNLAYAYSLTGRRAEAIGHYKNVLAREPGLVTAQLNLGMLLVQEGRPEEAEEHLRTVLKQEPDNLTANRYLAGALASLKRLPEASEAYERVLKLKPDDAREHLAYAKLLEPTNPAAAEEHLRSALRIDPAQDEARLLLARLLEARAGSPEALGEAAEIYRQYLEKHPERRDLHVRLGEIYLTQKQYAAAGEQWEAARAAGDSSLPVAKALLQALLEQGAGSREQAVGNREQGTGNRGRLQDYVEGRSAGRTDDSGKEKLRGKAVALVREILAQDSRNAEMYLLYGHLMMESRSYQAAAEGFQKAAELEPTSPEPYMNLASALYLRGDYEAAVRALQKVSDLRQDTAGTYFLRAICLDKLHLRKPALDNYQRFLAVDAGKNADQEFQARQRSKLLDREIRKGIGGGRRK